MLQRSHLCDVPSARRFAAGFVVVVFLVGGLASCGDGSLDPTDPCATTEDDNGDMLIGCPTGLQAAVQGDELCMIDAQGTVQRGECYAEMVRFGYATDVQYGTESVPDDDPRSMGDDKLRVAIEAWNERGVDLGIIGGDYIDPAEDAPKKAAIADLRHLEGVFAELEAPRYHTMGNHDLDVLNKEEFIANTVMEAPHYSFEEGGYRFIFLDANYSEPDDEAGYDGNGHDFKDTWVNPSQLAWLEDELDDSDRPVLVFSHQCLSATGVTYVGNAPEIRRILEASDKVVGVFSGHAHRNERMVVGDIPYFVMNAMTSYKPHRNAFGVVRIYEGGWMLVEGREYQASYLQPPDGGV